MSWVPALRSRIGESSGARAVECPQRPVSPIFLRSRTVSLLPSLIRILITAQVPLLSKSCRYCPSFVQLEKPKLPVASSVHFWVWKSNSRRRFMSADNAEIYRPSGDQLGENIPSDPGI